VTVLNSGTLAVRGNGVDFDGRADSLVFGDLQQTQAILTYDTGGPTDKVVVIDAVTGNTIGSPRDLIGQLAGHPVIQLGPNTVGVLTDTVTGSHLTTTLNTINFANGGVASPVTIEGRFTSVQYDPADVSLIGTPDEQPPRTLITQTPADAPGGPSTTVTILNSSTGAVVGTPQTVTGEFHQLVFNETDTTSTTRALLTYTDNGIAKAVIINTTTGAQLGGPITLAGSQLGPVILSADGTRATIISTTTDKDATTITTIDLTKGSVL
jgi:hypothetical protein